MYIHVYTNICVYIYIYVTSGSSVRPSFDEGTPGELGDCALSRLLQQLGQQLRECCECAVDGKIVGETDQAKNLGCCSLYY